MTWVTAATVAANSYHVPLYDKTASVLQVRNSLHRTFAMHYSAFKPYTFISAVSDVKGKVTTAVASVLLQRRRI